MVVRNRKTVCQSNFFRLFFIGNHDYISFTVKHAGNFAASDNFSLVTYFRSCNLCVDWIPLLILSYYSKNLCIFSAGLVFWDEGKGPGCFAAGWRSLWLGQWEQGVQHPQSAACVVSYSAFLL